jgi:hypothetical protein
MLITYPCCCISTYSFEINEGVMKITERLKKLVTETCAAVIDDNHPLNVEAVGGQEHLVFQGSCAPGDEGLISGAPGRPWTEPHGHTRFAAVLDVEKPHQEAVTRGVHEADESAMTGEGVGHD